MRTRVGPFRRAALVGALVTGLVFALSATAFAAQVPVLPSTITPAVMAVAQTGPVAVPVQGADRVATAIEASKLFGTADTVVLATGNDFPDALGGSALAGAVGGPILLTRGATIEAAVLAEIDRLGATEVYILGGTGAVPAAVETALEAADLTVTRLAGANRYATAKLVADEAIELLGEGYAGEAFLATGLGYADALAAAPIMYAQGMPLVLADGAGAYTLSAGMDSFYVLGGTGAVPASVDDDAEYAGRLSGASRYETAIAVANFGVDDYGMSWNDLGIATGEGFADALAAGPLLGSKNSVLLMTQGTVLTPATEAKLLALAGDVDTYYVFGGTGVINAAVRADVQAALTPAPEPVSAHALPDVFCTGAGCHDSDLAMIHVNLAEGKIGCTNCHGIDGGPKSDCESCHTAAHATSHPSVMGADDSCLLCHDADPITEIHADCTSCHNASTDITDATCDTCHATVHAAVPAHTVTNGSGGCFDSLCHGTDVTKMHGTDFRISGEEPPGCAACHAEGVTPSTTCLGACHSSANFGTWHNDQVGHQYFVGQLEANSSGCVSCHGTDLMNVAPGEHKGCSCHAYLEPATVDSCESCHVGPMDPDAAHPYHVGAHDTFEATVAGDDSKACVACHGTDLLGVGDVDFHVKDAHAGCVCHHYDTIDVDGSMLIGSTTTDATTCVSCHNEAFAPHGFADGESPHHSESWVSASGHNTAELGTRGAYTKFDGSEGVLVRDSSGATVTAEYPLPTQNVFWSADTTEAPEGAIKGLDWDSVVTCEDCHTGLVGYEVDGPHGAQQIAGMGIDPAFPGEFETAALWAWAAPAADGTFSSTVTSVTPMAAKSGIIQYVPGGPTPTAPSAYALRTFITSQTAVPGPAVVENPDSVICAKCHDLHNPGTGHNATGDGDTGDGYAHYHGHDYHDNPVENAGLYQRSDGTTYTAFSALTVGDTTLKAPAAGRGASGHCRNCHVAIPHGWSRPRLLVYETDRAPYNIGPSVEYLYAEAEGRVRSGVGEAGQLKGISSTLGPQMNHEGEVGEYVNWQNDGVTTCEACGHHQSTPTPGSMWE